MTFISIENDYGSNGLTSPPLATASWVLVIRAMTHSLLTRVSCMAASTFRKLCGADTSVSTISGRIRLTVEAGPRFRSCISSW